MNNRPISTPSADTNGACVAPARSNMPARVRLTSNDKPKRRRQPGRDDRQAEDGIPQRAEQRQRPGQQLRHRHAQRRRAPDHLDALVDHQDQPERRQHLVEMVPRIQVPEHQALEHDADQERRRQREQQPDDESCRSTPRTSPRDRRQSCIARRAPD